MEVLDGSTIFWLITVGMVAGAITKVSIWKQGVGLVPNLIAGAVGSVIVGSISIWLQFSGSLVFALLGSLAILFILNVFHLQSETSH